MNEAKRIISPPHEEAQEGFTWGIRNDGLGPLERKWPIGG